MMNGMLFLIFGSKTAQSVDFFTDSSTMLNCLRTGTYGVNRTYLPCLKITGFVSCHVFYLSKVVHFELEFTYSVTQISVRATQLTAYAFLSKYPNLAPDERVKANVMARLIIH